MKTQLQGNFSSGTGVGRTQTKSWSAQKWIAIIAIVGSLAVTESAHAQFFPFPKPSNPFPQIPDPGHAARRVAEEFERQRREAERRAQEARRRAEELARQQAEHARELDRQRLELQRQLDAARRNVREITTISSNKNQVIAGLRADGWQVALGKEIDYAEYYNFYQAVAASVATYNPGPVMAYLEYMIIATKSEICRNLNAEARRAVENFEMRLIQALNQAIRNGRMTEFTFLGFDFRVGVASYNHWKSISGDYPEINRGTVVWRHLENRVPLPNTHQPYVAFRLRYRVQ